jgi:hypothetical protein
MSIPVKTNTKNQAKTQPNKTARSQNPGTEPLAFSNCIDPLSTLVNEYR